MSDISAATPTSQQPTATLPAGYTAPTTSSSSGSTLNGVNPDSFLQLLVAELQNQNPSNPTDPSQFLSQTAEFEEVEQLDSVQTAVTNLVTAQQQSSATSMLGLQVSGSDSSGNPVSGIVSGIEFTSNGPILTVGDSSVAYSSIASVTVPGETSSGTSSSTQPATDADSPATGAAATPYSSN